MKALTLHAPEDVRHSDVPEPAILDPRDALVRVELAAICGSDLHVYHGREQGLDVGTTLGHEFLGTVVQVGSLVDGLTTGTRVVSPFTTSCGVCHYCRSGLTSRCERGELFGWVAGGHGLEGSQCEFVRVPLADSTLVPAPEGVAAEEVLLAGDVLATGAFCAESGGVSSQTSVAVLGCGPVGLMAAFAARELGASQVFALDRLPERLALAEQFGATPIDFEASGALAELRRLTGGRGPDVVLEAVGSPGASRIAYDLVRLGGTISAVGVHTESAFAFTPGEAYDKNLTYRAGRCPARAYSERMLAWLSAARAPFASIYSHRLPLAEGAHGYAVFAEKRENCTKVLLIP